MDFLVSARLAILQVLFDGPSFGLEVIERVEQRTLGRIKLGQGSVYPALRELEAEGLVTSYDGATPRERRGRPRRYYRLTADGVREAREARESVSGLLGLREAFLD